MQSDSTPDFSFMPLLPNTAPDSQPICRLPPFTMLNLTPESTPNSGPNAGPNSGPNAGPRIARKKPVAQAPTRKPRKAGPHSRQGKRIRELFGAPLKIYNPRRDARVRAKEKAKKNGATPEEVNAVGRGRKVCRSHPGSTIPVPWYAN